MTELDNKTNIIISTRQSVYQVQHKSLLFRDGDRRCKFCYNVFAE